jgi:hypothetical protein
MTKTNILKPLNNRKKNFSPKGADRTTAPKYATADMSKSSEIFLCLHSISYSGRPADTWLNLFIDLGYMSNQNYFFHVAHLVHVYGESWGYSTLHLSTPILSYYKFVKPTFSDKVTPLCPYASNIYITEAKMKAKNSRKAKTKAIKFSAIRR